MSVNKMSDSTVPVYLLTAVSEVGKFATNNYFSLRDRKRIAIKN